MLATPHGPNILIPSGAPILTPSIVLATRINIGTADWSTQTIATHASTTGKIVVFFAARTNKTTTDISNVTWNGDALTRVRIASGAASIRCMAWMGYIDDGDIGTHDLVITAAGTDYADLIGWIVTVDRMLASPIGAEAGASVRVVQGAYGVTLTPENANSLLLGLVAANDEDLSPFSVSAGWTIHDQAKTGNAGVADIAAMLGKRTAGSTSATTLTATADAGTTDDWAAVALELLPA